MRPERPVPEELALLLTELEADRPPQGILILAPKRRLRKRSYVAVVVGLLAASAVAWNVFALIQGADFALAATIETALEVLIVLGSVIATVHWDLRRRDPKRRIVVTKDFLASLGDEMGIQWAGAWEVGSLTAEGMGADEASRQAPSIQVIFKNGDVEDMHLDSALEDREIRHWLEVITAKLEYEDRA